MGYESDILVSIGGNASGFQQALQQAEAEVKSFVRQVEAETGQTMETVRHRVARSMGTSLASEHAGYSRDLQAMVRRDMYPTAPGLGQEMVAPGLMGKAIGGGRDAAILRSFEQIAKVVAAVKTGLALVNATQEAWNGNIRKTKQALEKLPPVIKEASQAGWWLGEKVADRWIPQVYGGNVRGQGPRAQALAEEAYQIDQAIAADAAKKAQNKAAYDAMMAQRELTDPMNAEAERRFAEEREKRQRAHEEALRRDREFIKAQMDQQREIARVESAIRAQRLRDVGKFSDAEKETIRAGFEDQIRLAEAAGKKHLADMLRTLRDLELAAAGANRSTSHVGVTPTVSRFLTRAPGTMVGVSNAWDKNERRLTELKAEARKQGRLLERIARAIERGGQKLLVYGG